MCKTAVSGSDASAGDMMNVPMSGTGGAGPSGSGGSPQSNQPMTMTEDDAGHDPSAMSTGGHGATDAGGGGGSGGSGGGGTSGSDSGPAQQVDAYTSCTMPSDCKPAGSGCLTDASAVLGSACQPPCKNKNDCPVPPGSYTAVVTCNADKLCVLDCSPDASNLTPGTCPGDLSCTVLLDTTFACLAP